MMEQRALGTGFDAEPAGTLPREAFRPGRRYSSVGSSTEATHRALLPS